MRGREIATGDIHGASASLCLLLSKISPQPTDHIILLGDLIDYGPDSRGVLDQLMALSAKTRVTLILGNHEERFLDCLAAMNQADTDPNPLAGWLTIGGQATLRSFGTTEKDPIPEPYLDWLKQGVNYVETDRFIFLHANYANSYKLDEMPGHILRWEFLSEKQPPHWSGKTIVVGHTTQTSGQALDLGHLVAIDTGAGLPEGWLTAFDTTNGIFHATNEQGEYRTYRRSNC